MTPSRCSECGVPEPFHWPNKRCDGPFLGPNTRAIGAKVGPEKDVPGAALTARALANPDETGVDMPNDSVPLAPAPKQGC